MNHPMHEPSNHAASDHAQSSHSQHGDEHDPLRPHSHDPNPEPPSPDPSFHFAGPNGRSQQVTLEDLRALPQISLSDCYIVSTGHGTSGPFTFGGPTLLSFIQSVGIAEEGWQSAEVISRDGFGTRVHAAEIRAERSAETILLAIDKDGEELTRADGSVRLIVPSERDDALRQVKWIGTVRVV